MNELIDSILKVLPFLEGLKTITGTKVNGTTKITYSANNKEISISVMKIKHPFMEYVEKLDDDVFDYAINAFFDKTGISAEEFNNKINTNTADAEIAIFKEGVKEYVTKRIAELQKYVS